MKIHSQRGFRATLTIVGALYALMACSMLLRGPAVLREFGVTERVYGEAVFGDFFMFFYQLMSGLGLLTAMMGHVVRERGPQLLVSSALCVANLLLAVRDLSTSDSAFGSHLYCGPKTLVFVYIDLALALVFAVLAMANVRDRSRHQAANDEKGKELRLG
jgi:hypothetical protein